MYSIVYLALLGWLAVKYSVLFGIVSLTEAVKSSVSLVIVLTTLVVLLIQNESDCGVTVTSAVVLITLTAMPPTTQQRRTYALVAVYVLALRLLLSECTILSIAVGGSQLLCQAISL